MGTRFTIEDVPDGGADAQDPKIPRMVHGGFRQNHLHQWRESTANETGMARDVLRQTGNGYPDDLKDEGVDRMMEAWGARGSNSDYRTSKWAKKG